MTGFGEARFQDDRMTVAVEVRSVNNRHLKLVAKIGDPFASMEPELERIVREVVRRGTVQLVLRVDRPKTEDDYRLNFVALKSYFAQIQRTIVGHPEIVGPVMSGLLGLPGVVERRANDEDDPKEGWSKVAPVVRQALEKLQASRADEGRAMAGELLNLGRSISIHLENIIGRVPAVVSSYRDRLTDRITALLEGRGVVIEPKDLIREVAILAERADIAEEITRLKAHLVQYVEVIHEPESAGRKLEFVVQEMGRETNTIGSKANDMEISREVVEIKGVLEKVRELIQNVE